MEEVDALRDALRDLFSIYSYTIDKPARGNVRFQGHFLCELEECFDELRQRFEGIGFTPLVREEGGEIALTAIPTVFDPPPSNWRINLVLVLLTIFSTLLVATAAEIANQAETELG
ncbi:MAG: hypothetical protein WA996_01585, partial [Candidatus Promineifilaceae bacterium]